jgi:AcrR family transcriptional regulator
MTTSRAPTQRYQERKSAIVGSAVRVMNRKGMRGMTLADVAAQLNIVPTGVIYYFKNKEELAQACFLHGIERFDGLLEAAGGGATVRDRLGLFLAAYFDFRRQAQQGATETVAVFNDVRALNRDPVNQAYIDMFRRARALLSGPETDALSRAALNSRTHLLLSEILWTTVWIHRHDVEDFDRAARRMLSIAADGFAAPGVDWNPVPLSKLTAEPGGGELREQFLQAATQLINEEGYVGASVEKISARLNVTKGAFYHHNETKDELVLACFERTFEVMRRAIRQAEQVSANGFQTLATAAAALVEHQLSGKAPLLRTSTLTSVPEAMQPALIAKFNRIADRLAALISDGIADGSVRPVCANIGAQMVTGMINAAAELRHWTPGVTPQAGTALYARPLFTGLLSPAVE